MSDLVYLTLLRERVRQQEAEDRRLAALGPTPHARFVPIAPTQLSSREDRGHAG
jgi:hypothetical protein